VLGPFRPVAWLLIPLAAVAVLGPPTVNLGVTWRDGRPSAHERYVPGEGAYRIALPPVGIPDGRRDPVGAVVAILASWSDAPLPIASDGTPRHDADVLRDALDAELRRAGFAGRWRTAPNARPDDHPQPFIALLDGAPATPVIVRDRYGGHVFVTHPVHGDLLYPDTAFARRWEGHVYLFTTPVDAPEFWR
jgi:hypothetical protein